MAATRPGLHELIAFVYKDRHEKEKAESGLVVSSKLYTRKVLFVHGIML